MKEIIEKAAKDIKKKLGKNLVSLYLVGTAATSEKKIGDVDFFAIIKKVDFNENELNDVITKKYSFPIRLRAVLYDEIYGKVDKGTDIMKYGIFDVPIFVKILESGKLILGKRINFKKLPIKELNPKEYLLFEINKIKYSLELLKQGKELPFRKEDFPKFVGYIVRAELFLRKKGFFLSYAEMSNQLKNESKHIIHDCVAIKHGKKKMSKDFLNKVEVYIKRMEKELK